MEDNAAQKVVDMIKAKKPKGAVITTGDDKKLRKERLPFGVPLLDKLTSGGLSYGRMTLIYGAGSVGKTFICQKLVASAQKLGKSSLYICIDKTFEPDWWTTVGVDVSNLAILLPAYGEQAWDMALTAMENSVDLVIMDSIDAIVPTLEAEASMDDASFGTDQARCNTKGIRKAQRVNNNSVFVCLNHTREGVGKYSQKSIPGGKAQEDFASLMLWIVRGSKIEDDNKKKIGFNMRATVDKDKVGGRQFDSCELPFLYEGGALDSIGALFAECQELGIIKQEGAWYSVLDQKVYGKNKVKDLLKIPEIQEALRAKLAE